MGKETMNKINFNLRTVVAIAICLAGMTIFASCAKEDLTADDGVVINGVRWATRNVNAPGKFTSSPDYAGKFYQWNCRVGYTNDGLTGWDSSTPSGTVWESDNDPSPAGWRVPTLDEVESLLDTDKVKSEWTTKSGVTGRKFTDKNTGANIFLPSAGALHDIDGELIESGTAGYYWSSTRNGSSYAYGLNSHTNSVEVMYCSRAYGLSIRPVAK